MATNTWSGTYATQIAQRGFSAFIKKLLPLRVFTTDFSPTVAQAGDSFTTRVTPAAAAAGDLTDTHSGSRLTAAAEGTTTIAVNGTLNQEPISGFHLTDTEYALIGAGVWSDTLMRKIDQHAFSVANAILNYVFNLITAASYSANTGVGAASAFDLADIMTLDATLADAGWPIDGEDVGLVLKPTYLANLKQDAGVVDMSASGLNVVRGGFAQGTKIDIFNVYQAPTLPPAGGTPASENLVGFACTPDAIAIANRMVAPQAPDQLAAYEVMTDPDTGLTMVYRADYYDGTLYHTFEALFGAVKANGEAIHRLVSS